MKKLLFILSLILCMGLGYSQTHNATVRSYYNNTYVETTANAHVTMYGDSLMLTITKDGKTVTDRFEILSVARDSTNIIYNLDHGKMVTPDNNSLIFVFKYPTDVINKQYIYIKLS